MRHLYLDSLIMKTHRTRWPVFNPLGFLKLLTGLSNSMETITQVRICNLSDLVLQRNFSKAKRVRVDEEKEEELDPLIGNVTYLWAGLNVTDGDDAHCAHWLSLPFISFCNFSFRLSRAAVLLHQSERRRHREQSEAAGPDHSVGSGGRGKEVQGRLLGGVWCKIWDWFTFRKLETSRGLFCCGLD